ncbi:MAG: cytochrome C biogenesis protein [Betaproteobacteria bacterium RIFCSPLOWO2_02_FULL_66_14]|nr:MAG: cytochrome C biogenesis protein [Betaproteobacteria bacterium RIFCSPLOWO2_02_FULL_66_14]
MKLALAFLAALLLPLAAPAREAPPVASDVQVEQRLMRIAEELRCLVCQNESLAASRADLALDLKREVRELIKAGKTDDEIREFLVKRYGDFVLYRPPLKESTALLWAGPFALLVGGFAVAAIFVRRRRAVKATALSTEDERRADALLKGEQP